MEKVSSPELLFYQKIGELFYAVAASDKIVREAEYKMLTQLVEDQWKKQDDFEDQFGTDAAYQISIVFEWFDYERMDANDCFESFVDYYKDHKNLFSEKRKDLIMNTVKSIADAFNGSNKSELIMITNLQILLNKN
ncbi:hypothetical protein ATE92_2688 [Ulvibacter sp. MAR_2010_11]|uniref:hypothetical protein n=1 Tax=Ulvibacter sp. MAR_2010_11 TaxID=1250229 RepID=UPI000C2B6F08|nr:hypothetical protein [Ulvibacter sp. MAR_2010_11]PKA84496.1 hypothetical protein ATE92_2688 [Ulvibacter sp. MAR_2010_11]